MVLAAEINEEVAVPEGVTVTVSGSSVAVKGPRGELSRDFGENNIVISREDSNVVLSCKFPKRGDKALMGSLTAHIRNMVTGVTAGFKYALRVYYSHFPMNVEVQGDKVLIKNFLGEKHPRESRIVGQSKVTAKGQDVTVEGTDKEDVGQTAANLVLATKIKKRDPRVFRDGIFIVEKGCMASE
ncbi:MAG: 50S ribosomal protein L6 [Candidatus Diapherotrites archaeon]|nr:50S ribosomal protein L6 [Candidatus Diapherotrites archaeon]